MSDTIVTPNSAGWYPDPRGSGQLRWWNGIDWTENLKAGVVPGMLSSAPMPMPMPSLMPYPRRRINLLGLLGLVLALIGAGICWTGVTSLLTGIFTLPAVILGILGVVKKDSTKGMAGLAILISTLAFIGSIVTFFIFTQSLPSSEVEGSEVSALAALFAG